MTRKGYTKRKPNPGKRQLFPSDNESLKGRYRPLSPALRAALVTWAQSS